MSKHNRERRRGRDRDRDPLPPSIYPAADKAQALRHAPPEVLAQCVEVPCAACGVPLLPVRAALAAAVGLAGRLGQLGVPPITPGNRGP
jgi:hypothetical protein